MDNKNEVKDKEVRWIDEDKETHEQQNIKKSKHQKIKKNRQTLYQLLNNQNKTGSSDSNFGSVSFGDGNSSDVNNFGSSSSGSRNSSDANNFSGNSSDDENSSSANNFGGSSSSSRNSSSANNFGDGSSDRNGSNVDDSNIDSDDAKNT
ncbi:3348_t:CDS:2 [Funneliformis caledonium]|uniref:3348_t:CDS:1 n=1 Tax=Funneliformis caledonium TaxID=1117310 RepID=A0A9N9N703_9GLOM|nr:3348_t:CDS:2 [Funneliformis caledonium]